MTGPGEHPHETVFTCDDCRTSITIPDSAWDVARAKSDFSSAALDTRTAAQGPPHLTDYAHHG